MDISRTGAPANSEEGAVGRSGTILFVPPSEYALMDLMCSLQRRFFTATLPSFMEMTSIGCYLQHIDMVPLIRRRELYYGKTVSVSCVTNEGGPASGRVGDVVEVHCDGLS